MERSHYNSRLQSDLDKIREAVQDIADGVRESIDEAVLALLSLDRDRMYDVILADHPINRKTRALDAACHAFVARHIPAAGHLRFVSSVLRINIALERIGDYASTICRVGVHLDNELDEQIKDDVRVLADQASRMLELATRAFIRGDAELARDTAKISRKVDRTHDRVFLDLVKTRDDHTLMDIIRMQTVYDKLERVSDQAKNICEEAAFVSTGKVKVPKVYKVLFVGHGDDLLAPLAEALARRAFPNSGKYTSAGISAANAYHPTLLELRDELDLDLGGPLPVALEPLREYPAEYHVLVGLNIDAADLPPMPFHTVRQLWTLDVPDDPSQAKGDLVRVLSDKVAQLMETLRGDDAT